MTLAEACVRAFRLTGASWRFLRRFETRALLLSFLAAAALWSFFSVADALDEAETKALDRRLILALRTPGDLDNPIGPRTFEEAVRDVTALGGFTVIGLVSIVAVLVFLFHGRARHAAVMAGAVVLALISSEGMKAIYARPRPDLVPHESIVYSASFPSGHSTLSATTYLTLAVLIASLEPRRRTKALVYGLALALLATVGMSRIYLGVHWPSDVLGGWCLGAAWAFVAWVVLRRIGARTRG